MSSQPSAERTYDFLVLGGGSAGSAAAAEAVKLGAKRVAMVNDGELGGLCILRGCMPTKSLLHSSDLLHELRAAEDLGIEPVQPRLDVPAMSERRRQLVARFKRGKVSSIENGGYEVIDGRAVFSGPDEVLVTGPSGEQRLTAKAYLIATGSKQSRPPIPGLAEAKVWTSNEALEVESAPKSLLIAGAGAIGLEFATFFSALGTEVTVVNRSPVLNAGEDPDLSARMKTALEHLGVRVLAPAKLEIAQSGPNGFVNRVIADGETHEIRTERFLLATGRVANLEGLGLERAGVEVAGGQPVLDPALRTTNPKIFAAGDAAGQRLLLHTGNAQGRHVARQLEKLGQSKPLEPFEDRVPLAVTFTHPPYADAGLRAAQARAAGLDAITATKDWANQGRGIVMNAHPGGGFVQLVADRTNGRLLGAQILGPRADELIHVVAALLWNRATVHEMLDMPWYHPTLAEGLLEMARELSNQSGRA